MRKVQVSVRIVRLIVGLSILGYLIYIVEPNAILAVLAKVNYAFVPLWLAAYLLCLALGALNIHLLLRPYTRVSYLTLLRYDIVATSLGYFTPAQIGAPIALALNLKKEDGVLLSRSVSALLIDKLNTFVVAAALGVLGVLRAFKLLDLQIVLGPKFAVRSYFVVVLLALLITTVLIVIYFRSQRIRKITRDVLDALDSYRQQKKFVILNFLLTIVVQSTIALIWVITFRMIGNAVEFKAMITTAPAISLVAYLPVTIGGIGTQELSAVFLWKAVGVSAEVGLSSFLVARGLTILTSLALLALNMRDWSKFKGRDHQEQTGSSVEK
ncbi:UPF0104 family protein [bacterium]|nr:MAG: UPF0104 family protein [bacterium]